MSVSGARMQESPTRLLATGDIGHTRAYHVGDEAMMLGLIDAVADSGAVVEWTLMSAGQESSSERFGARVVPQLSFVDCADAAERDRRLAELDAILAEPPTRWPALAPSAWRDGLGALVESDAVLIAGGGNLSGHWPEHVYERAAVVRAAKRAGRPVAITGQTIGPAFDPRTRELVAEVLAGCVFAGMREEHSYRLALELGGQPTLQFDDGIAVEAIEPQRRPEIVGDAPFIAVTLNQCGDLSDPGGVVAKLAAQLVELGRRTAASILLVPHVGDRGGDPVHDVAMGRAVIAAADAPLIVRMAPLPSPQEAVWYCREAQLVVSTRYHPVVFATGAGTPALFLCQDRYTTVKGQGALALAGLQDWSLSVAQAASGLLVPAAMELWRRRDVVGEHLRRLQPVIERSRAQHVGAILSALAPARVPRVVVDAMPCVRSVSPEDQWIRQAHDGLAMRTVGIEQAAKDHLVELDQRLARAAECTAALTAEVGRKDADLLIAHDALQALGDRARNEAAAWRLERAAMDAHREGLERHEAEVTGELDSMRLQLTLVERRAAIAEKWAGVLAAETARKESDLVVAHSALEALMRGGQAGDLLIDPAAAEPGTTLTRNDP
ncbi:MAG: polysaccharide pyruvyl transferase family protein [Acidobacteriota bacterium]